MLGKKQVTSLSIEGKEGFSRIKRVDIYWPYYMSGTVGCISNSLPNLNIKILWDRFYCSNYFYLWQMRQNFPSCEKCLKLLLSSRVYHLQGSLEKIWIWGRPDPEQDECVSQCQWKYEFKLEPKEIYEEWFYQDLQDFLELQPRKYVFFIIRDWNASIGGQEIPGATGKFGLGARNEAGQRLTEFCQENTLVIANTLSQQHKRRL